MELACGCDSAGVGVDGAEGKSCDVGNVCGNVGGDVCAAVGHQQLVGMLVAGGSETYKEPLPLATGHHGTGRHALHSHPHALMSPI